MNAASVLVGGIVPALCLGLGTVLMRSSVAAGASIPTYLAVIGTTIALIGWISMAITGKVGGLRTLQFDALVRFYEACLAPLGYTKCLAWEGGAGFGRSGMAALWIGASTTKPTGIHIALSASNHAAVDAFHKTALDAGAIDNGKPGLRPDYHANYYAAFVTDPDGNNLEAVCHAVR